MRLINFQVSAGIAAVTVRATENHVLFGLMHRLDAAMTFEATDALRIGQRLGLVDLISRR